MGGESENWCSSVTIRVALYSRVSTADQDNQNQLCQLRQYCASRGFQIECEYVDICSGGKGDRIQLRLMLDHARKRKFDLLLFWSLDRLSREGVLATLQYLQQLTSCGVDYQSYTEQYLDSLGPFRDAVLAILACIARQERVRISERTIAGLAKAKAKGRFGGRPSALRPYQLDEAKELRSLGVGWSVIAKRLAVHPDTVRRGLIKRKSGESIQPYLRKRYIPSEEQ
jgi:DNA invertase Pin-like site-specific DNA recombinase